MIIHSLRFSARCLTLAVLLAAGAHAEPYLAVAQGVKCSQCHVNPTGGGLRNAFGNVFAQTQLPAHRVDTGSDVWAGQLSRYLALGADLRFDAQAQQVPHSKTLEDFQMEQTRLYLSANVIPERLLVYVDEQLAPGGALNREAYGLFWSADHSWYLKGGQMYLPFGLRLQDQTSFVGQVSGINMTTPDEGVEFGWLKGHWTACRCWCRRQQRQAVQCPARLGAVGMAPRRGRQLQRRGRQRQPQRLRRVRRTEDRTDRLARRSRPGR